MLPKPPKELGDIQNGRKTPDFEELAKKMTLLTK
jgi:hypothetical protein